MSGAAVEDVTVDFVSALQRDSDVAPIIEGLFEGGANFFIAGELRNPAFEIFMLAAGGVFELFGIGGATLGYAHDCVGRTFLSDNLLSSRYKASISLTTLRHE